MAEKILIASQKGGVGATTFCVGLGFALCASGAKVLIVDENYKYSDSLIISGCANLQVFTLKDYSEGACRAKQIIIQHPQNGNFFILSSLGYNDENTFKKAILEVEDLFDYVILDNCAKSLALKAVVITEPYLPSIKSADVCISELRDGGIKDVSVAVNKINGGLIFDGAIMQPEEIALLLHAELKAVIPEDLNLPLGKWKKTTLKAFKLCALNLSGKKNCVYSVVSAYYGVKGKFLRKIRSSL